MGSINTALVQSDSGFVEDRAVLSPLGASDVPLRNSSPLLPARISLDASSSRQRTEILKSFSAMGGFDRAVPNISAAISLGDSIPAATHEIAHCAAAEIPQSASTLGLGKRRKRKRRMLPAANDEPLLKLPVTA